MKDGRWKTITSLIAFVHNYASCSLLQQPQLIIKAVKKSDNVGKKKNGFTLVTIHFTIS